MAGFSLSSAIIVELFFFIPTKEESVCAAGASSVTEYGRLSYYC